MSFFQYGALVEQVAITATSGGTTTLVNTSKAIQVFTGSTTQTIVLPNATTMSVGQKFEIYNESTGNLTVETNGGATLLTVTAGSAVIARLQVNGTTAGTWMELPSGSASVVAPTIQRFTSGAGTYTTPTSPRMPLYIKVTLVGGGGGGAGINTGNTPASGTNGTSTVFGNLTGGGGAFGNSSSGFGGPGGTATGGAGWTTVLLAPGGGGGASTSAQFTSSNGVTGGIGGSSMLGGAGASGSPDINGQSGSVNTGGGGGGGGSNLGTGVLNGGTGGGSGGGVIAIATSLATTYSYSVGPGGTGGTGSATSGGSGGSGIIIVEEYYQ